MKKLSCMLLIALLFVTGAAAEHFEPFQLTDYDVPFQLDLDGDGAMETICWHRQSHEPALVIESAAGYEPVSLYVGGESKDAVWFADLDDDGIIELLRSGDYASDDEYTTCRHYKSGSFELLSFPENDPWGDGSYGIGMVHGIDGNALTLEGYVFLVGSHYARHTYTLVNGSRFEPLNDGLFTYSYDYDSEEELIECEGHTVLIEIPYTGTDGTADGALVPGDVIVIVSVDRKGKLCFKAADGRTGVIHMQVQDPENAYSWLIEDHDVCDAMDGIIYAG